MVSWTHWHNEPLLVGTLVLAAWAYALAVGPWRFRIAADQPYPRRAVWRFFSGIFVFYLAVGSPLDQIGERFLFSAHMLQHMIIIYIAAPLVLVGTPAWLIDRVIDRRVVRPVVRTMTAPVVTAVVYALVLSLWHVPAAYDAALRDKFLHIIQHLMFFAAAIMLWWPLISPSQVARARPPGVQVLYVVGMGGLQFPLVAFLNFSREVLYPTYEFAPRLINLSPQEDQVLGGAMMGIGGMLVTLGLISWSFICWHRQSEPEPAVATPRS